LNPRCDVEEKEGGLNKEEVKMEYDEKNGILSILGEKKHER
jgi:hypothetical protein